MKKAKHTHRKFNLSRETIASLDAGGLAQVEGDVDSRNDPTCEYTYKSLCPHELCPNGIAIGLPARS